MSIFHYCVIGIHPHCIFIYHSQAQVGHWQAWPTMKVMPVSDEQTLKEPLGCDLIIERMAKICIFCCYPQSAVPQFSLIFSQHEFVILLLYVAAWPNTRGKWQDNKQPWQCSSNTLTCHTGTLKSRAGLVISRPTRPTAQRHTEITYWMSRVATHVDSTTACSAHTAVGAPV